MQQFPRSAGVPLAWSCASARASGSTTLLFDFAAATQGAAAATRGAVVATRGAAVATRGAAAATRGTLGLLRRTGLFSTAYHQ